MESFPFSQNLFWDCNIEDIDLEKNSRYVIERVLTRGQMKDFKTLLKIYDSTKIKNAIIKSKELDPKTAHFCSWYFHIPESNIHVSPYYN
jgi:hypothetical protein